MERKRPAADRIRPIIEAMERSIDSARRKRCQSDGESETPPLQPDDQPKPESSNGSDAGNDVPRPSGGDDGPPRLKARPKRPMNLRNPAGGWRSAS